MNHQLALGGRGGGVHLHAENAGVLFRLRGNQVLPFCAIQPHFNRHRVAFVGLVHVVIHYFESNAISRIDAQQFFSCLLHRARAVATEVKPNGHHARIVVGRLQLLREQPTAALRGHGDIVGVTGGHHIAAGNFQRSVLRQCANVDLGGNEGLFSAANFHVIDRYRVAKVFIDLQARETQLHGVEEKFPFTIALNHSRAHHRAQLQLGEIHQPASRDFHRLDGQNLHTRRLQLNQPHTLPREPVPIAGLQHCAFNQLIAKLHAKLRAAIGVRRLHPQFISPRSRCVKDPLHPVRRVLPIANTLEFVDRGDAKFLGDFAKLHLIKIHRNRLKLRRRGRMVFAKKFPRAGHVEILRSERLQLRLAAAHIGACAGNGQSARGLFRGGKNHHLMHSLFEPNIHEFFFRRGCELHLAIYSNGHEVARHRDAHGPFTPLHQLPVPNCRVRLVGPRLAIRHGPRQPSSWFIELRRACAAELRYLCPGCVTRVVARENALLHRAGFFRNRLSAGQRRMRSNRKPKHPVMAPQQPPAHGGVLGYVGSVHAHAAHGVQLFHIHRQQLGRETVRLALPKRFAAVVDGHQGIVADCTIRRRRARGQFGGGDGRAKLACVWTGLH